MSNSGTDTPPSFISHDLNRVGSFHGLTRTLNDSEFNEELPEFGQYVHTVIETLIIPYLESIPALAAHKELLDEGWQESGLQDDVLLDMVHRVFDFYNLNKHSIWRYFTLQHIVKRYDLRNELIVIRDSARDEIEGNIYLSELNIIDVLADTINEMITDTFSHNRNDMKINHITNVKLFVGAYTPELFIRKKDFIENTSEGAMLKIFNFIYFFSKSRKESPDYDTSMLIAGAFSDVRATSQYQLFAEDPDSYAWDLLQKYLIQTKQGDLILEGQKARDSIKEALLRKSTEI